MSIAISPITTVRRDLLTIVKDFKQNTKLSNKRSKAVIIVKNSSPVGVLLPYDDWERLNELEEKKIESDVDSEEKIWNFKAKNAFYYDKDEQPNVRLDKLEKLN
jgi:PHD/YefM family antitoxin component YafN of YafNO toxin-antitoxin module